MCDFPSLCGLRRSFESIKSSMKESAACDSNRRLQLLSQQGGDGGGEKMGGGGGWGGQRLSPSGLIRLGKVSTALDNGRARKSQVHSTLIVMLQMSPDLFAITTRRRARVSSAEHANGDSPNVPDLFAAVTMLACTAREAGALPALTQSSLTGLPTRTHTRSQSRVGHRAAKDSPRCDCRTHSSLCLTRTLTCMAGGRGKKW